MHQSCIRLLRWLLALELCLGLIGAGLAGPLNETPDASDIQISAIARIQQAAAALDAVRQSLDDADATDTLQALSDKAVQSRRDADAAVAALAPLLAQLDARAAQLGPAAEGAQENPEIAQQRQELGQRRGDLDSAIKRGKLLSVEAAQAADSIEKIRTRQFNAQIAHRAASPLSPTLWRQFAEHAPADWQRLTALFNQGRASLSAAVAAQGWGRPLAGLLLAALLALPLRLWLRRAGRRFAASDKTPDGRLRRTGLAVWLLVVGTALPGLASLAFIESLRDIDAIAPRLQSVATAWVLASFVAAFFLSVSACLLSPRQPAWRLLDIDDEAAPALTRLAWGAATLAWFSMMLNAVDLAARTSAVNTVALDGLIALAYAGLILSALAVIKRQRKRQQRAGSAHARNPWLMLAWLGGHLTVLAALAAALLGYLNFSMFVATQMVWITVVALAASLLMRFADDFFTWLCASTSRSGQALAQATGLAALHIERLGVLLSALTRVGLGLLGLAALAAPFGTHSGGLLTLWDAVGNGLPVGDAVIRPMALARGLLALALGLGLFHAFQRWLVQTYLPKTELDLGARNSISTVARYAGIILSGLWALAALGIGLEKIALLASALSVGIGFGLQAITQNFVSGLILLAERPVKLGDRVRIGEMEGNIRRISVRATEIQTDDKATLIVPNSELITKSVRNISMDNALGRIAMAFAVPLSTDVVRLKQLVLDIYGRHPSVLTAPPPSMYVDSISGGAINITSFGYVASPGVAYGARSDLLFELLRRCAEEGIALSSPADIHVIH